MKRSSLYLSVFFIVFAICAQSLHASVRGRVDVGGLWMRVKLQANKKTVNTIDMWGGRFDTIIFPFDGYGVCIKPFVFGGKGDRSNLLSLGAGLGHYTPVTDWLTLVPLVGISHTNLHTRIDVPVPELETVFPDQKEKIESSTFYFGGEAIFKINKCWYLTAIYNYGFARVQTRISGFFNSKGSSSGSNFGLLLDYYYSPCMSVNLGFGYNKSLDDERYGIEGYGVKAGLTYLF